jgi:2',3'-cyclic-nucleotide 2'-phosphodiesterase (5'-nucleotidase family)
VGIIGAIGDCYSSISADKTEDVYFKVGSELTRLVKEESQRLRTECGVDFVVYVIHDGYGSSTSSSQVNRPGSYYSTELSNGYVDLVFEGHTHQAYCFADEYGVYHLQNRGDNKGGVSHAQLKINYVTGSFTVDAKLIASNSYRQCEDDPIVGELLEKYKDQISIANRVLGTNSRYRSSEELGAMVAKLYYELGVSHWGDQYTITMGGGSLSTRSPYNLKAGEVKYGDLQSLFPFDNEIRLCAIKGKELKRCFLRWDNYYAIGEGGALKEADIDDNAIYYVVLDTWTSNYDAIDLTIVEYYTPGIYARDLLAEFIASGGLA